jgi:hypothetical protein
MRLLRRSVEGLLSMALVACSSSPSQGFTSPGFGGSDGGSGGGAPDAGGTFVPVDAGPPLPSFGDAGGGDGGATDCAGTVGRYIYVISDANDLYTFDPTQFPSASAFTKVGPVTCDGTGVNSMAVDRSGTAWVNFNDGAIFRVTTTAPVTCSATTFMPGQAGFTKALGMGFSVDAPGSDNETLYVSDNGGPGGDCSSSAPGPGCMGRGLGTIDISTMILTALGPYTGPAAGYNAELTGTGDGKLYGFFTTTPGAYGPIDKTNGATNAPASLPSVNAASGGYAFSFWGGDFYFYTEPNAHSIVTHLQSSTGMTTASPELSFTIVGAGVSTCAPTIPAQ